MGGASAGRHSGPTGQLTAAQAAKLERAREIEEHLQRLTSVHRIDVRPASRPMAPEPAPVDETLFRRRHRTAARRGVPWFDLKNRRLANRLAEERTQQDANKERLERRHVQELQQRELDDVWQKLRLNDPSTILSVVSQAFEDNEAPAAPLAVNGEVLTAAVLLPGDEVLPTEAVGVTSAGNLSIKRATKAQRAGVYRDLAAGIVVATAREALAVCPGLAAVRVCGVRRTSKEPDFAVEALVVAELGRQRLATTHLSAGASAVLEAAATELVWVAKGAAQELQALRASDVEGLAALIDAMNDDQDDDSRQDAR